VLLLDLSLPHGTLCIKRHGIILSFLNLMVLWVGGGGSKFRFGFSTRGAASVVLLMTQ
jgi:hypothetical protein